MRVAINGAGIGGPTLAYWLERSGHEVLLVEEAPQLRSGGYIIDFWGVGYDVAEKMSLISRIRELGYQVQEVRFVDRNGERRGGFYTDVLERMTNGRFTSVRRSDLSATIYSALDGRVETMFGDSISSITEKENCVQIGFDHSAPREVDLLIGADGLHSRVRQIAFGEEDLFAVSLGYHVAAFEIAGYRPRDELVYVSYGVAGKQISRFSMREDKTLFLFIFLDKYLEGNKISTRDEHKSTLQSVFKEVGWESQEILAAMENAGELYFDSVSQIRMDSWTRGRIALVGDAAACVSLLAGEGTGLAMVEAYVLAGELSKAGENYSAAFAGYERRLMPFLKQKQKSAAKFASSFAPKTAIGITFRNLATHLLRIPIVANFLIGNDLRDEIELPDYGLEQHVLNSSRLPQAPPPRVAC